MQQTASSVHAIHELLETQVQCALSTVGDGRPSQHLMAYAFDASLHDIFVASLPLTEKARNMLRDPNVSLLWDNRTGNTSDHRHGVALAAQGEARPLQGWIRARAAHLLQSRNPEIVPLLNRAGSVVFRVRIDHYRLARGYNEVTTWHPAPNLSHSAA